MARMMTHMAIVATCFTACLLIADVRSAQAHPYGRYNMPCGYNVARHDLFYNYYIGPGNCGTGIPAQMYLSPRPTPPLVPHEMLYKHHRTYYRTHPDGTGVRTKVVWY